MSCVSVFGACVCLCACVFVGVHVCVCVCVRPCVLVCWGICIHSWSVHCSYQQMCIDCQQIKFACIILLNAINVHELDAAARLCPYSRNESQGKYLQSYK